MDPRVEYEMMTPAEIVSARKAVPLAFVPVGPIEWHGPHLPLGTDGLHAHAVAVRVAHRVGGIVLPTLFAGTETVRLPGPGAQRLGALGFGDDERIVGMDFPHNPVKSLYFEESAFGITVREVVRGLKADHFQLVILLNGHGAPNHQRTLQRIAVEETAPPRVRVQYYTAWQPAQPPASDPGHAERWETAILMALDESLVRLDRLPDRARSIRYQDYGIVNGRAFDGSPSPDYVLPAEADPRDATRAEGEAILETEVNGVVANVRRALDEIRHAAIE